MGKFNEVSLPEKDNIYSYLNTKDITDADYVHAQKVGKDYTTKNLTEFHDLSVQSDTLLLTDVFTNFQNMS